MTQEKQAEATPEVAQASPDPKVIELESKVATLTTQVEDAKREAKSHQEYGRKTKEELDKQRGLDGKVTRLEQRLEVATDMIADLLDRNEEAVEETQPKRRSETYRSRLAEGDRETKETQDQSFKRMALEADGLLKSIGLKMKDSPETMTAYVNFLEGNPDAGLEEVKKIVADKQVKTEVKVEPQIDIQKAITDGVQAELKRRGLLDSDTGSPSGGMGGSVEKAYEDYRNGVITTEEARKRGVIFS